MLRGSPAVWDAPFCSPLQGWAGAADSRPQFGSWLFYVAWCDQLVYRIPGCLIREPREDCRAPVSGQGHCIGARVRRPARASDYQSRSNYLNLDPSPADQGEDETEDGHGDAGWVGAYMFAVLIAAWWGRGLL